MCNYFEYFLERRLYFKALIINLLLTDKKQHTNERGGQVITETRQHDATSAQKPLASTVNPTTEIVLLSF